MQTTPPPSIKSKPVLTLNDGTVVSLWTLRGSGGIEMDVLTYGGIVSRLTVPDREGKSADVVLGFRQPEKYLKEHPFFGAIVGRIAGRIPHGRIKIEGKTYQLPLNEPKNHLHGGSSALDKKHWTAKSVERPDSSPCLELRYLSPDGEQGYPGEVLFIARYSLTPDNAFVFETEAHSDRPTPISLTHHGYFQLNGERNGNILQHRVQILSDHVFACDEEMTLLDRLQPVDNTAADFRKEKEVGSCIDGLWQKHGDLYWLGEKNNLQHVATVTEPKSGRMMEVHTTHSCLQFYTGVNFDGTVVGKSNVPYQPNSAFCMECEDYPNASNTSEFGDSMTSPDKPRINTTLYHFKTAKP